jgi:hypothetical protein
MSDEVGAPGSDALAPVDVTPAAVTQEPLSASDAARLLQSMRGKKNEAPAESAEPEQAATAEPESTPEGDDAAQPEKAAPSEDAEVAEPADEPSIEPPRSWTKEAKERWSALPRETQEYLSNREQERDREVRRSQNEAAEARKAVEAELSKVDQVRKDYEAKLPALLQALQDTQAAQFPDIKTMADVERLANEDPFRYLQWQAHQQKLMAVNHEAEQAKQRETVEKQSKWTKYVQEENSIAAELHPELADPDKAQQLQTAAVSLLKDKGFTQQELTRLASGEDWLSIYDHRIQSLLLDGVKYQALQKAPPKAVPKAVPPVQRPGVAPPRGAANVQNVQALSTRLAASGRIEDAVALLAERRKAR